MAFVVTEPCIQCKYTDCVAVCPVDCFREGGNFLVIDPDICIDCGACVPECPVEAIYDQDDVPAHYKHFIKLNAELAPKLPEITEQRGSLSDSDEWKTLGKGKWSKVGDKEKIMKKD